MVLALIILIGSTALLITASNTYQKNSANDDMSDALEPLSAKTVTLQKKSGGSTAVIERDALQLRDGVAVLILDENGDVLTMETASRDLRATVTEEQEEILQFVLSADAENGVVGAQPLRYMKAPLDGIGTKVALKDRASETEAIYFQFRLYIVLAFIILVLILALCDFLARRSILPVDDAIRNQQQFIADASHELKTPLTVILANLDIISSHPKETVEEAGKWLENTKSEAKRMSKLVNEMLFLARSDAAMDMHYNFRLINFSDVVDEVVLATEALAFERNISLNADVAENSQVVGDFERLKQVVMILVENATKYVDENGTIEVRLTSSPRRSEVLTVTNTGTSIPPEKAGHIFDRFYRVDESRVRDQGGYGLGLSIAQNIVEKHNGEIALDFSDERGTQFSVRLPHAQNLKAPDLSAQPETE